MSVAASASNPRPTVRLTWPGWPLGMAGAVVGLLLGQATLYAHVAPFAWALILVVAGVRRSAVLPTVAGAAVGTAVGIGVHAGLLLVLLGLVLLLFPTERWPLWLRAAAGGIGAVPLLVLGWRLDSAVVPMALLAAAVGVSAVLAVDGAFRWVAAPNRSDRAPVSLAVALYCAAALCSGLEALHWGWFLPGFTVGAGAVLLAAVVGGPAGGALAGATLGVVSVLRATGVLGSVGMLAVAGFVAGLVHGRYERFAGPLLVAATAAYAVFLSSPRLFLPELLSMAVGAAAFTALPSPTLEWLKARATRLGPAGPRREDRIADLAHVLSEMARLFQAREPGEDRQGDPVWPTAVPAVVGAVCRHCSLYGPCWDDRREKSVRGVRALLLRAADDRVGPAHVMAELDGRCIKPDRVAAAANRVASEQRRLAQRDRLLFDTRQLVRRQLAAMADLITEMARETVARPALPGGTGRLAFSVGVAKRARNGADVSGDTHLVQEVAPGRVAIGLSDGMGVGRDAAWESTAALSLLEEMLRAGFSEALAVRAVNTALLVRDPEERFATLDVMVIDLEAHRADLLKVAAAPTFIVHGGQIDVIRGESLPVGILDTVSIAPFYRTLEPGDWIIMVSDGALGPPDQDGEAKLVGYLETVSVERPDVMAETLLALMLDLEPGAPVRDDASVLAVRVDGAPMPVPERVGGRVLGEWRRLTTGAAGAARHRRPTQERVQG
jgi:stage II sporulation protein E